MEDLEPICEAEQTSFCVELLKRLNMQRGQGYLCDITLVAKEGNEFKAHRNVLSAASPFFVTLLQSDMKEKEEGVIRFEEISASIMEDVLGFIYTGNVEIDDEQNAKDLIIAADYLLLVCLKTVAGRFLEKQLTISNCVSTFYFAEKYRCEDLVESSTKFILENFASVAESDEFLNLEAEQVASWISSDEICIAAEEDVLKIIEEWIERNESDRKGKFEELFRNVRLVFLSRDSLLDFVTHNLVSENYACTKMVLNAIAVVTGKREDDIMQSPRRSLGTEAVVACGGKHTLCYLPQRDEWKFLANSQNEKDFFTQMITFRDQLFTFNRYSSAERYDPVFGSWSSLENMRVSSSSNRIAVVRGHIYRFSIDILRNKSRSLIERYNMGSLSWDSILKSGAACREDPCLVAAGNCLYVMGGKSWQQRWDYVAKAERFDIVQNKWEQIADMQEARGDAFGVATEGKIFVAGGRSRSSSPYFPNGFQTCEVYSISKNEWQLIGSLNVPRLSGSMVCVYGTLYVLGGKSPFSSSEYSVESYDPTANVWRLKTSIPSDRFGDKRPTFKACALKLSKGMLEKLK